MYIFTVTISTDAGGKSWILSSKMHFTSPPARDQQVVFDVSEDDEERMALSFHVLDVRHYIESNQDANFAVVQASQLDVEHDVADQLVKGLVNFLGDNVTECIEDVQPWYEAALEDFGHFSKNNTSSTLQKLVKTVPDGNVGFLRDREQFMRYYALKWEDGLFKDLSVPESSEPTSDAQQPPI